MEIKNKDEKQEEIHKTNIPKSTISGNTYKDFNKICRAYYDELMHISKEKSPSLSKKDIIIIDDLIHEIINYSNELLEKNLVPESRKLIDIGLVISDFVLKIFGEVDTGNNSGANNDNQKSNNNLIKKLKYPLSLKLILLESNFNLFFRYEKNYLYSEKTLNEIIEIQGYLQLSNYNISSSKFYMGLVKFFNNNIEEAEKYALEAKTLLENKVDINKSEEINDMKKTRKMSNILNFLAEIYQLKKEYKNALSVYENAYYLNLGRYGGENVNTLYFKNKLDLLNEEIKKYIPYTQQNNLSPQLMMNSTNSSGLNPLGNNNFQGNIMHKGRAETFSFKIPTSSLYEPFLISIYSLGKDDNNRYSPELYLGNICFDKIKLMKYLKEKDNNNNAFYTDENLNKILTNIVFTNGFISFLDKNLKSTVINSSAPLKTIIH